MKVFPSWRFCLHFRVLNLVMPFSATPEETFLLSRVMSSLSPEWKVRTSPTAPIKAQSLLRLDFFSHGTTHLQMAISIRLIFSPSGNRNMRSWCKLFLWLLCFAEGKKNSLSLWPRELFFCVCVCVVCGVCVCVCVRFTSVTQSCPTLWPHGLQHARPPCPSPTPGVYSNSCPWRRWCCANISPSVVPFSSCLQSSSIRVFSTESALHIRWSTY